MSQHLYGQLDPGRKMSPTSREELDVLSHCELNIAFLKKIKGFPWLSTSAKNCKNNIKAEKNNFDICFRKIFERFF